MRCSLIYHCCIVWYAMYIVVLLFTVCFWKCLLLIGCVLPRGPVRKVFVRIPLHRSPSVSVQRVSVRRFQKRPLMTITLTDNVLLLAVQFVFAIIHILP